MNFSPCFWTYGRLHGYEQNVLRNMQSTKVAKLLPAGRKSRILSASFTPKHRFML